MLVWYAQELPSSCVAACVRIVLGEQGTLCAEAAVRRLLRQTRLGVSLAVAQARLTDAGALAQHHADWNLTDLRDTLRAGQYPIVGVERSLLGYPRAFHALVLSEITSAVVSAFDPLDGPGLRQYGHVSFVAAWELAGREALVIEAPPPVIDRQP